ncbi:hypothetical protein [Peribacillus simplex]
MVNEKVKMDDDKKFSENVVEKMKIALHYLSFLRQNTYLSPSHT